jgi:hypothetical protein
MRALFTEVLARTETLAYSGQPSYLRSNFQRGIKQLPITWITSAELRCLCAHVPPRDRDGLI